VFPATTVERDMYKVEIASSSTNDTEKIATVIAREVRQRDVLLLIGDLGAGKTTFTKAFCAALGVVEAVTSPTFTLVHHYKGSSFDIWHADLYRLERTGELADLGLDDARAAGGVLVVEWGDLVPQEFPDALVVDFAHVGEESRKIILSWRGTSWETRFPRLADRVRSVVSA